MKKNCLQCKTEYDCRPAKAHISKFCSVRCRCDYEKEHGRIRLTDAERKTRYKQPENEFVCQGCGEKFKATGWKKRQFCGRECAMRHVGQESITPWNKGESKETDDRLIKMSIDHSKCMLDKYKDGMETWNKGLTKDTDERVADYVAKQTTWRNTDSDAKDAWKQAMSKGQVIAHAAGKYPHTFTIPEQITWAHLESLGWTVKAWADKSADDPANTWYHQYNFEDAFVPDFACPDLQCIIEVNGCYHHGHDSAKCDGSVYKRGSSDYVEDNIKRDRRKYSMYHRHGWKWALVWECEAHGGDFHRIEEYLDVNTTEI